MIRANINVTKLAAAVFLLFFFAGISNSCRRNYTPRPYGFFRVTIPPHEYRCISLLDFYLPYKFEMSKLAELKLREGDDEVYWVDIVYPTLNATIHGSFIQINDNLFELTEDARRFAFAHVSRASDLRERLFYHPEKSVFGLLYDIRGNVASPIQFFVTDSVQHFFRGALYFFNRPNQDSIAPMLDYVYQDIIHLIETFEWR